jgi:hypothetical protein
MIARSPQRRLRTWSEIAHGLVVAGVLVATAVAIKLVQHGTIGVEVGSRLFGALTGGVLIGYANALPKVLVPLVGRRCDPAAEQALRRFAGWTLCLGGIAYTTAWLAASFEHAGGLAIRLLGAALLIIVTRVIWMLARRVRT